MNVAINGFGRIGRSVARILARDAEVNLVAVNDLSDPEQLAHLFKYDTVHGTFDGDVSVEGSKIHVDDESFELVAERDPSDLPWGELGVDYVLECTGKFRTREDAGKHLQAGADHVLISAPGKGDIDYSVVYGVNHGGLEADMEIIDNASCTTNCLAPIAKVLNDEFGIESGSMTTVHSYTNSQNLLDGSHNKDWRRARAAAENIVPTTTGAAKAVTGVLPELEGKLDGMAVRVPTPNVSLVDLVVDLKTEVTKEDVDAAMKNASDGELAGVLGYTEEPLVSSDLEGNPHSSVYDADSTMVTNGNMVKVISWYDNEWGFSNRMIDVVKYMQSLK
jgi:glyceraldehyde 3-phosphate dehydrogenase